MLQKVEMIDASFKRGSSRISELTGFFYSLAEFDFENAHFIPEVLNSVKNGRTAADAIRVSLEELMRCEYGGGLARLGEYVDAYVSSMLSAFDEMEGVYSGLEDIMKAVEPALREEAAITQMEAPKSNQEWLQRLYALDSALEPSVSLLRSVEVTPVLEEYKSFMLDLLATLHKLVRDLIPVASGAAPNVKQEENPDFLHIQKLKSTYPRLLDDMYGDLEITAIDPVMEQVELEINRLYLEEAR